MEELSALVHLQALLPSQPKAVEGEGRSNVVPMKILFKDEKYKSETIDILIQLVTDAGLCGKPEVVTCVYNYMYMYIALYTHKTQLYIIHVHVYHHNNSLKSENRF